MAKERPGNPSSLPSRPSLYRRPRPPRHDARLNCVQTFTFPFNLLLLLHLFSRGCSARAPSSGQIPPSLISAACGPQLNGGLLKAEALIHALAFSCAVPTAAFAAASVFAAAPATPLVFASGTAALAAVAFAVATVPTTVATAAVPAAAVTAASVAPTPVLTERNERGAQHQIRRGYGGEDSEESHEKMQTNCKKKVSLLMIFNSGS